LQAMLPKGFFRRAVMRYARNGIEFSTHLSSRQRLMSSTHREMYGLVAFIVAVAVLLAKGTHRVVMDNLGCVFILGGRVPEFAAGGKQWGEFASGGSRDPELQRLATVIFDLQEKYGFRLCVEWRPREENVRADYLAKVSEMRHHHYRLRRRCFRMLEEKWGPHSIDLFASPTNQQPLAEPFTGRFCSHYFHPDALWTDAFALPWAGENCWISPPVHRTADAVLHLRESGACGTVITFRSPWASWWEVFRSGPNWAGDVVEVVDLGDSSDALVYVAESEREVCMDKPLLAIRMDCRRVRHP